MTASEVGSGQVAIFPTFKGFRKNVGAEVDGATAVAGKSFSKGFTTTAATTGATAGKTFSRGFTTNSADLGAASLKSLQAQVAKTASANSAARLREQDAIGRVNVAQASYNATIGKYAAGSVQFVRATESLGSAQRKAAAASDAAKGTYSALTAAQGALKLATENTTNSANKSGGTWSRIGSNISSSISDGIGTAVSVVSSGITAITGLAVAGATAVGVTIGAALTSGFSRLTTIETAQAKLKALGNDSATIAEIMSDANNAVIGTQYSLAEAVTAAASATAAGIKPGQDLTKYLKLQANAAALAGVDFGDLGLVMNQVQSQNKAYTQDLNQVAARGIPIYQSLAKVYGTTQEGLRDLLQQGGVDAEHFRQALELNVGDAADEIGKTTVGSFENMKAAFARFGAQLLSPVFPAFSAIFTGINKGLDRFSAIIKPIVEKYGPKLGAVFAPLTDKIGPAVSKFFDDIAAAANSPEGQKWFSDMGDALTDVAKALGDGLPSLLEFTKESLKLLAAVSKLGATAAPSWIHGASQISDFASTVSSNLSTAADSITEGTFWDNVFAKFGNGGDQIAAWWAQVIGAFGNGWTELMGMFGNGWSQLTAGWDLWFANLGPGLANGWTQITDAFGNGWSQLMASFANGWSQISGAFSNGWSQIIQGFANGWSQILSGFANGWAQISGFFTGAGTWLLQAGKSIVQGLIDGIRDMIGQAGKAASDVMGAIANFFPHSPAKEGPFSGRGWTPYSGQALVKGFADGISSGVGYARSAASSMTSAVAGAVNAPLVGPQVSQQVASNGGGGQTREVTQHIHPAPGMSEVTIGRVAASEINFQLRSIP